MKKLLRAILGFTALAAVSMAVGCNSDSTAPVLSLSNAEQVSGDTATCDANVENGFVFKVDIKAPEDIQDFSAIVTVDGVEQVLDNPLEGQAPDFSYDFAFKCSAESVGENGTVTFKVTDKLGQTDELTLNLKVIE